MRIEQWRRFKSLVRNGATEGPVEVALIWDSPWMPGYLGIGHMDFFADDDVWFEANRKVAEDFPEVIPLPSWWAEYGMAIEPSAFGTRLHFHDDQTPGQSPVLFQASDIDRFAPINPLTDGLMPWALRRYRTQKQRIFDAGYTIPMVAVRGPMCTAAFVRGLNDFLVDLGEHPEEAHRLLKFTTEATIRWIEAQAEAIGPSVEGLLLLDDVPGLLSRRMYLEFAQPYMQQVTAALPAEWIKVYHNDARTKPFLADLPDSGFQVLNFTHNLDIGDVRAAMQGRMVLLGNVAPLDIGVRGTPGQVHAKALEVMERMDGTGMILSVGGGVSPGMPGENIRALVAAAKEFNASRVAAG